MKGYRFYLEFPNAAAKRKARKPDYAGHSGNVVAVYLGDDGRPLYQTCGNVEAVASVYSWSDSPVCTTGVDRQWLRTECTRIQESLARQIHPRLFTYLES